MTIDQRVFFLNPDVAYGPSEWLTVSYMDPDNYGSFYAVLARGDLPSAALSSFGAKAAILCDEDPERVSEWIVSGLDHGVWYCGDPDSRAFLAKIPDPGLRSRGRVIDRAAPGRCNRRPVG